MVKINFPTFNPSAWFHIQGQAFKHSTCSFTYAVHSAASCTSMASCEKTNNHTEIWFELTYDKGCERSACVAVTADNGATYRPNKENQELLRRL
jgi:hypothetical protein